MQISVAMDHKKNSESDGLGSPIQLSQCEGTELEGKPWRGEAGRHQGHDLRRAQRHAWACISLRMPLIVGMAYTRGPSGDLLAVGRARPLHSFNYHFLQFQPLLGPDELVSLTDYVHFQLCALIQLDRVPTVYT
jgi:hypothetical protein